MNDLFKDLSQKSIEKLFKIFEAFSVKFTKGINVLPYMNKQNTIAIVMEGSVSIELINYDGNATLIEEVKKDEIFGAFDSIIHEDECYIITNENTTITFLDYNNITNAEFIKSEFYITFIQNFLRVISKQLSDKNERIQILTKKSIREKLLTYFNILSQKKGKKNFELPFSLSILASYLGVDRSAMMREIKNLKEDGMIESKGKYISLKI